MATKKTAPAPRPASTTPALPGSVQYVSPLSVGTQVFIRTVTFYYTGLVVGITPEEVLLIEASWIPSSGRWHETLAKGIVEECEPYPAGVVSVSRSAIVDVASWNFDLPRAAQ
jgi:hypothetical protein